MPGILMAWWQKNMQRVIRQRKRSLAGPYSGEMRKLLPNFLTRSTKRPGQPGWETAFILPSEHWMLSSVNGLSELHSSAPSAIFLCNIKQSKVHLTETKLLEFSHSLVPQLFFKKGWKTKKTWKNLPNWNMKKKKYLHYSDILPVSRCSHTL